MTSNRPATGDRLLVDATALGQLVEAAYRSNDPAVATALAALIDAGTGRPETPWLTIDEAARTLRVSTRTIRRQIAAGALPHRKIGTSVRIPRTAMFGPTPPPADHSGQGARHGNEPAARSHPPHTPGARP